MAEFTGERVVPNQVDSDLWNEHWSRYLFASRLARQKRVLDIACGTGYGTAELAHSAAQVIGVDVASEAVSYAAAQYARFNTRFVQASGTALPFPDASFDLVTAFEVIEHLTDWPKLLEEVRRLLRPSGQFIVSTPNKLYYAETREKAGPNPFHTHEFTFEEFNQALQDVFPSVSMFLQNHSDSVVFQPVGGQPVAETRLDSGQPKPDEAHFFMAVCALGRQMGAPTFIYLPTTANVLREREVHIARLEGEVAAKTKWLDQIKTEHAALVDQFRAQTRELEQKNEWAARLNQELADSAARVAELQDEFAREQQAGKELATAYESKVTELEADVQAKAQWAIDIEARLSAELKAKCDELAACVKLLQEAESTLEERTNWALKLDKEREELIAQLNSVQASRWYRLGRSIGLGPQVQVS